MPAKKSIPNNVILELSQKLEKLPERSRERGDIVKEVAEIFGVSKKTVYRRLRNLLKKKKVSRKDAGFPRVLGKDEMENYCQIIAAFKLRSEDKKGRRISTSEAIYHIENTGIETDEGVVKAPKGLLKKSTVNYYLAKWQYTPKYLSIQTTITRFEAKNSNECWQFDISHSELKNLEVIPNWITKEKNPKILLYSIVDDRSGVIYQEYHVAYGEDTYTALRFLFNAMSEKTNPRFPFKGIPKIIYMDNGPVAKSFLFNRVMKSLEVDVRCHQPRGKGGRKTEARAKGKVERPFRTVKELHETLYQIHKPNSCKEANDWLMNFTLRYNDREHRRENHSRIEDWIKNIPPQGIRKMCGWEHYCKLVREPETRVIKSDAFVSVDGIDYQVDHELAEQKVTVWRGVFDDEIYVEHEGCSFGPYLPSAGPIPLDFYRSFKKTQAEKRAEKIEELASQIRFPNSPIATSELAGIFPVEIAFQDFEVEKKFPSNIEARLEIANYLGKPLAKLDQKGLEKIQEILETTLVKDQVFHLVDKYFRN